MSSAESVEFSLFPEPVTDVMPDTRTPDEKAIAAGAAADTHYQAGEWAAHNKDISKKHQELGFRRREGGHTSEPQRTGAPEFRSPQVRGHGESATSDAGSDIPNDAWKLPFTETRANQAAAQSRDPETELAWQAMQAQYKANKQARRAQRPRAL